MAAGGGAGGGGRAAVSAGGGGARCAPWLRPPRCHGKNGSQRACAARAAPLEGSRASRTHARSGGAHTARYPRCPARTIEREGRAGERAPRLAPHSMVGGGGKGEEAPGGAGGEISARTARACARHGGREGRAPSPWRRVCREAAANGSRPRREEAPSPLPAGLPRLTPVVRQPPASSSAPRGLLLPSAARGKEA